jgi:cell division septum initiation protein DivIVA
MDASSPGPALGQATNGYPRAEVEKFLDDVARERARLEAEIEDSTRRIKRAEATVSTHRVMVTMLMQTQRELAQIRRDGEREADRILQEAE